MIIRRVAPLSAAKVFATVYFFIGLLVGALFSLASLGGGFAGRENFGGLSPLFGAGAIIILPCVYAVFGFIGMLIVASIYNWAAGIVGGIDIQFEPDVNRP